MSPFLSVPLVRELSCASPWARKSSTSDPAPAKRLRSTKSGNLRLDARRSRAAILRRRFASCWIEGSSPRSP